jgi:hypothetical protein
MTIAIGHARRGTASDTYITLHQRHNIVFLAFKAKDVVVQRQCLRLELITAYYAIARL